MLIRERIMFAQRYLLTKLLGRGGFSEVWLAVDKWTNLDVAIKIYAPGKGMDEDGMNEFCKELANVYNINHTNLVKPQHVDNYEGMPYLVMAFCSRGSCHHQIGQMKEKDIWKFIADVASGLAYLHERSIIHQDIKPDNILLDDDGNYVITDFGISVQTRETMRKNMASGANASGTRAYMGPERFSRNPKPIPASDIWSLGATVYELVTGRVPFGESGGGMQSAGASLPTISAPISPTLSQVIARMLAEDPEDRPTAALLADWAQNPDAINLVLDANVGGSAGTALLKVRPSTAEVEAIGGEFTLFVKSSENWKVYMQPAKWIDYSQRDTAVVLKAKPNQTGAERHHEISIVAGARAVSIPIRQKSLPKSKLLYWLIGAISMMLIAGFFLVRFLGHREYNNKVELCTQLLNRATTEINKDDSIDYKLILRNVGISLKFLQSMEGTESRVLFSIFQDKAESKGLFLKFKNVLSQGQPKSKKEYEFFLKEYGDCDLTKNSEKRFKELDRMLNQSKKGKARDIDLPPQEFLE